MTTETASRLRAIPSLTGIAPELDVTALPAEPVSLFYDWLAVALASEVAEPGAMTLATVDAEGLPDARVHIIKDVDERGWAFAGPSSGAKAAQLAAAPAAALSFWWQPLVRSIRVRGPVVEASREDSLADLAARGADAQRDTDPDSWTLWRVQARTVEFWQGARDRRHTRIHYRLGDGGWVRSVSPRV